MKRFEFRLQALFDIKKRTEDDIKKALAKKNNEIILACKEKDEMEKTLEAFFNTEKHARSMSAELRSLRHSISYRAQLQKDIIYKDRTIQGLRAEATQIVTFLTQARKECKILETLKDKKYALWKKENNAKEQQSVDDISQKGFIRKQRIAAY